MKLYCAALPGAAASPALLLRLTLRNSLAWDDTEKREEVETGHAMDSNGFVPEAGRPAHFGKCRHCVALN